VHHPGASLRYSRSDKFIFFPDLYGAMKSLQQQSDTVFTPSVWKEVRVSIKYLFFPTEEDYLLLEWYVYHRKALAWRWPTVMEFLDERVRRIPVNIQDVETGRKTKIIENSFLRAILNEHTREGIIEFFEKPMISMEDIWEVQRIIRQAWRVPAEEAGVRAETAGHAQVEESEPLVELVEPLVETTEPPVETAEPPGETAGFPAKAYVIATQLHFELAGKEKEYLALSTKVDQLACFIKDKFAAGELPRNFPKFKGYSYKPILGGKNKSKKGQLKPFFRQIAEHPEVFGDAESGRAQTIFNEDFKD
jgi:hypothetical protein